MPKSIKDPQRANQKQKPEKRGVDNDDLEGRAGDYRAEREIAGKPSRKKEASSE